MTIERLYQLFLQNPSIQTDTRKLRKGDIFFALSGPNFNGNQFASQALEKGAAYAIVDEETGLDHEHIIKVRDVLTTLQQLSKYHRQQFTIPFIAITGSNGKTTTKELVNAVLSSHYKTYTTQGNLNNHIGVPLTILSIQKDAQVAVIEMGANHQKEIEGYCVYAMPTHGIITNCGKAHLEGFGGVEGVRKGKGELFDYLRNQKGTAFIFNDFDYLHEMSRGISNIVTYGTTKGSVTGKAVPGEDFLRVQITNDEGFDTIQTQLVGDYNLPNVLCAVAVGKYFKVPIERIADAIKSYVPGNSRSQMVVKGGNHIILDAYNANPSSMKVAIENMVKINAERKVLMLGGMMELGEDSLWEHQNIIEIIKKHSWQEVVLVGGVYKNTIHPFIYFDTAMEAGRWFREQAIKDAYILIKGSRSIQMEKILDEI